MYVSDKGVRFVLGRGIHKITFHRCMHAYVLLSLSLNLNLNLNFIKNFLTRAGTGLQREGEENAGQNTNKKVNDVII